MRHKNEIELPSAAFGVRLFSKGVIRRQFIAN